MFDTQLTTKIIAKIAFMVAGVIWYLLPLESWIIVGCACYLYDLWRNESERDETRAITTALYGYVSLALVLIDEAEGLLKGLAPETPTNGTKKQTKGKKS